MKYTFLKPTKQKFFGWDEITAFKGKVDPEDIICHPDVDPRAVGDVSNVSRFNYTDGTQGPAWAAGYRFGGCSMDTLRRYMRWNDRERGTIRKSRIWRPNKYNAKRLPLNPIYSRRLPLP